MFGILIILLVITLLSGSFQFLMLYTNMNHSIDNDANMISNSIQQGITETDLASKEIEHQIDLKLESYSGRVGEYLKDKDIHKLTQQELLALRDKLGLAGISVFGRTEDDIVGVMSTDDKDIGFSFKQNVHPELFKALDDQAKGQKPVPKEGVTSYVNDNVSILYVAQSGSHTDDPVFYKYAYYHTPGTSYLINVYIEASEVYNFVQKVGPDAWIEKVLKENEYVKEIALLDPKVFADPSLMENPYFPFKQVINGKYELQNEQDIKRIIGILDKPSSSSYIQKIDGKKVYKMLVPIEGGHAIYVALDYNKLIAPLYQQTMMQAVTGIISLLALFFLISFFFNRIYKNIQKIKGQIKMLEAGDFTAHSQIIKGGELGDLSDSANRMVTSLKGVLKDTNDQAEKVQRLSMMLEAEADQSVEKMFALSMETTSKTRDMVEEMDDFLTKVEAQLSKQDNQESARLVLDKVDFIRNIVKEGSNTTTDITLTLSDLMKSLHGQSSELSDISNSLLKKMAKFKL
jgi:methyl-accepting chemotaxis protein